MILTKLLIGILLFFTHPAIAFLKADTSFIESELVLTTGADKIYGSLIIPKQIASMPVALIIAGSGPTDRNGNGPFLKNDALKQLAESLAMHNIASVRFDKRGVGRSMQAVKSESLLRFDDYVNDVSTWIELLKKDKRFKEVIVIGHSEGSLIGMLASPKAGKFISIAGVGRPAAQLLKEQLSNQPPAVKDPSIRILDSMSNGKLVDSVPPVLFALFRPSVQPYMISWFKWDPTHVMSELKTPVLIIQGSNDLQVSVNDARMLKEANKNALLIIIDKMNHVLKEVSDSREENIKSYSNAALPISTKLVDAVIDFINKK